VLDLNLPRLDGIAILRFLRARKPSMPILVLTWRTRVEDRVLSGPGRGRLVGEAVSGDGNFSDIPR
jgi:CheY-like chemotaxis protein